MDFLNHSVCLLQPKLLTPSAWVGHTSFGMWLISALRPATVVELGSHTGLSYCAFCQAVAELKLPTRCWAVDTWEGDPQAGLYGPEVLAELRAHHDPLYRGFSTLLQKRFDDALADIPDGSVELLHIDGLHTYEAVRHDWDTWRPKLSPSRAVVLFHDTAVRDRPDFGVWKLWQEITTGPEGFPHFHFEHAYGLGVLGVGRLESFPEPVRELFVAAPDKQVLIRLYFERLAERIPQLVQMQHMVAESRREMARVHAEINAILASWNWRVGKAVTLPAKLVARLVKS